MPNSKFRKLTLENGLRIILAPRPESPASTALVLVEAGSEYETKRINGLSHFLEHMCFKGTKTRPKPGIIAHELDAMGSEYNAFTSQEYTGYFAKVQNKYLDSALEIIADLYLNQIFDPAEIERERGVIIEELNMYEDTPMRRVHDLFSELLYGDQPAGWDVGGRKEVIRRLKREDFIKYRRAHYVAQATVVVVVGSFNEGKLIPKIKETFQGMSRSKKGIKAITKEVQKKPAVSLKFKKTDQTHLVLGVRAFDIFDPRRYALQVLAGVLGGGMSSRLFHKVRDELGAAYYVRAGADLFLDHGYLAVSAGVDHQKIEIVIKAILGEMEKLKSVLVDERELKKVKDHLAGGLLLGLETSDELAAFYGGQEILARKILKPEGVLNQLRKVGAEDIRGVARLIFKNNKLNLAMIAPFDHHLKIKNIFKF